MQIIWHGQSCFQISISQGKNNHVNIVIDPFSEEVGLRLPKLQADILLTTHDHYDHNNVKAVSGNPFIINSPGEYEIKNVFIEGIPSWHDNSQGKERGENTIYTIEAEDLKLCHLGDFGQKELTGEQLEKIGEVDVLMIPIGGVYTISAKEALKVMSQLEPKIIIPMHYQIPSKAKPSEGEDEGKPERGKLHRLPKLNIKLDGLDKFLKMVGIKSITPESKFSIKKKDISPEEVKIIVLKP